jgi:hypothetical protein
MRELAKRSENDYGAKVLYFDTVTRFSKSSAHAAKPESMQLLLTDCFVSLDRPDSPSPAMYYWISIEDVDRTEKSIRLTFRTRWLSFTHSKVDHIYSKICDVLDHVLLKSEYEKLPTFSRSRPYCGRPGSAFLHSRIFQFCRVNGLRVSKDVQREVELSLMGRHRRMVVSSLSDPAGALPIVLDALPFAVGVDCVDFGKCGDDRGLFARLADKDGALAGLACVGVSSSSRESFDSLLEALEGKATRLEGFYVRQTPLGDAELASLTGFVVRKRLTSLGLQEGAVSSATLPQFLGNRQVAGQLEFLSLDDNPQLDFSRIATHLGHLTVLSLCRCGIQIRTIFSVLSRGNFPQLIELSISGNPCPSFSDSPERLPPVLAKVIACDIDWETSQNFLNFLALTMRNLSTLVVSGAALPENEWERTFRGMAGIDVGLTALAWDDNRVSDAFLGVLSRCRTLQTVSFCGCLVERESHDLLCRFFESSKTLETIVLRGTRGARLGNDAPEMLRALSRATALRRLDIGGNRIGDSGITALRQLLSKKRLDVVCCDGSGTTSLEPFVQLAKARLARRIGFPFADAAAGDFCALRDQWPDGEGLLIDIAVDLKPRLFVSRHSQKAFKAKSRRTSESDSGDNEAPRKQNGQRRELSDDDSAQKRHRGGDRSVERKWKQAGRRSHLSDSSEEERAGARKRRESDEDDLAQRPGSDYSDDGDPGRRKAPSGQRVTKRAPSDGDDGPTRRRNVERGQARTMRSGYGDDEARHRKRREPAGSDSSDDEDSIRKNHSFESDDEPRKKLRDRGRSLRSMDGYDAPVGKEGRARTGSNSLRDDVKDVKERARPRLSSDDDVARKGRGPEVDHERPAKQRDKIRNVRSMDGKDASGSKKPRAHSGSDSSDGTTRDSGSVDRKRRTAYQHERRSRGDKEPAKHDRVDSDDERPKKRVNDERPGPYQKDGKKKTDRENAEASDDGLPRRANSRREVPSEEEEEHSDNAEGSDWEFPLRYVPRPHDVDDIVKQLDERYSLEELLRYIKSES